MMSFRRIKLISTKSRRKAVLLWMIAKVEEDRTYTRNAVQTVDQFPNIFKQTCIRANTEEARKWWRTRKEFLLAFQTPQNKSSYTTVVLVLYGDAQFGELL